MSYHGHNAGPISGLIFPGVRYARGVTNAWTPGGNDSLNTPVVTAHTIKRCLEEIEAMNNAGLVPTFFFHTHELISGHGTFKSRFDNIVNLVLHQKLAAVPYLAAMETSFNDTSSSSGGGNNIVTRPCRISASEIGTLRPIKVDFSIVGVDGQEVDSATNLDTEVFILPVGDYTVKASINGNIRDSKNLTLTSAGGLHVIVYV